LSLDLAALPFLAFLKKLAGNAAPPFVTLAIAAIHNGTRAMTPVLHRSPFYAGSLYAHYLVDFAPSELTRKGCLILLDLAPSKLLHVRSLPFFKKQNCVILTHIGLLLLFPNDDIIIKRNFHAVKMLSNLLEQPVKLDERLSRPQVHEFSDHGVCSVVPMLL
jgi:hypothetical protein